MGIPQIFRVIIQEQNIIRFPEELNTREVQRLLWIISNGIVDYLTSFPRGQERKTLELREEVHPINLFDLRESKIEVPR